MEELQRGEKRKLAQLIQAPDSQPLTVRLSHDLSEADLSVFGLNSERKLQDDRYFVFYNQLSSPNQELKLNLSSNGAQFEINLAQLPAQVQRLVFVMTHDSQPLRQLGGLQLVLVDAADGQAKASVQVSGSALGNERALMIAELYLHGGEWRFANVSQGFEGGLEALLGYFGGEVTSSDSSSNSSSNAAPSSAPAPSVPTPPTPSASGMSSGVGISLNDFVRNSAEQDRPGDTFELESSKMLEVKVRGRIWSKLGAMIAYKGQLDFKRSSTLSDVMGSLRSGGGIGGVLSGVMNAAMRSQEMGPLASIEGQGVCYLADQGKEITIIRLQGDAINVNGSDLLAFEDSVDHQVTMQRSVAGMVSGGLFSVRMQGHGLIAILSHGNPLTLRVTHNDPIYTDPNATIAWSDHLQPDIQVDQSLRTLFGRGGGETLQMVFRGEGFVVVQPYEELPEYEQAPAH